MFVPALKKVIELVLPAQCVGCGKTGAYLCNTCVRDIALAGPLTVPPGALAFDSVTAASSYTGVAREAVRRLKYRGLRALAPEMAPLMTRALPPGTRADVVVPVPLHRKRLSERGYNQAALLGHHVAAALDLPLRNDLLVRRTQSGHQVEAESPAARRANVRDAFVASDAALGLSVLLVDDVTTTGSTLDAAAKALRSAGSLEVHCLTFAMEL